MLGVLNVRCSLYVPVERQVGSWILAPVAWRRMVAHHHQLVFQATKQGRVGTGEGVEGRAKRTGWDCVCLGEGKRARAAGGKQS